jgi:hypothetical protein
VLPVLGAAARLVRLGCDGRASWELNLSITRDLANSCACREDDLAVVTLREIFMERLGIGGVLGSTFESVDEGGA